MRNNLRQIRRMKNLTQTALAEKSGINRVSIARYESGRIVPTVKSLMRLSRALGVSMDLLLEGEQKDGETDGEASFRNGYHGAVSPEVPSDRSEKDARNGFPDPCRKEAAGAGERSDPV